MKSINTSKFTKTLSAVIILLGLYSTININYLLFHSLAEIFSIIVASCVFIITWNTREYIENKYLLVIGIAYLFIAFIDLLHTLSYAGMNIFTDYDFYANQLWIGARYMESLTLLFAFLFMKSRKELNVSVLFLIYTLITIALILSVFILKVFPICFIEGVGLTPFKQYSEFIICLILCLCLVILKKRKNSFQDRIYGLLFASIIFTIISELAFTFYISNYGISNIVGHYFKIFSFYLIYKAIVETGIIEPTGIIFHEIDQLNIMLKQELKKNQEKNRENEELIGELSSALTKVKQLSGLLPICSNCKKIRDDKGYWNQIETYISRNSEADFSHSLCPECLAELYPDIKVDDRVE